LGVIYILDRLTLTGNKFILSTTDAVSTQTFATEDKSISANIMIINTYLISLRILINTDFFKISTTTYNAYSWEPGGIHFFSHIKKVQNKKCRIYHMDYRVNIILI
jgi:hypothetical protein